MFDWNCLILQQCPIFPLTNSVWYLLPEVPCSVPANGHSTVSGGKGKNMELHFVLKSYTHKTNISPLIHPIHFARRDHWKNKKLFLLVFLWIGISVFPEYLGSSPPSLTEVSLLPSSNYVWSKKVSLQIYTNQFQMAWNMQFQGKQKVR